MTTPRTLIYDIETSPNLGYTWGKWDQNVLGFVREKYILCFAYRWYGESKIRVVGLTDYPAAYAADPHNDLHVVEQLHSLFEEADILIAHNGDQFDHKEVQRRFLVHGLPATSPYKTIDTKKVARINFRFNSNSLDDLGRGLGLGHKTVHTGFQMWRDIVEDQDPKAWKLMRKYNKQDVQLLTDVYELFLLNGWVKNHPNLATITGMRDACPKCGRSGFIMNRGKVHTQTMTYQQVHCGYCNSYSRVRPGKKGPQYT